MTVTKDYIDSLPKIYRDVLAAFPRFDPTRKAGFGLSYQSLYSALEGRYPVSAVRKACEQLAAGGAMEIKNEIFCNPTALGEELIAAVSGEAVPETEVPPFSPPPAH